MSRRTTPARIDTARREATLARLISAGMLPDRAEAKVAAYELQTANDGRRRDGAYWDAAWEAVRPT